MSHNSRDCQGITTACSFPTKCINHKRMGKENQNIQPCVTVFVCSYRGNCQVKSCICQHFLWNSYPEIMQSLFRAAFLTRKKDTSTLDPGWFSLRGIKFGISFFDSNQGIQKLRAFPLIFMSFLLRLLLN